MVGVFFFGTARFIFIRRGGHGRFGVFLVRRLRRGHFCQVIIGTALAKLRVALRVFVLVVMARDMVMILFQFGRNVERR